MRTNSIMVINELEKSKISPLLAALSSRITARSSKILLGSTSLNLLSPATDRDQPVSRNNSMITHCLDYTTTLRLVALAQDKPNESMGIDVLWI